MALYLLQYSTNWSRVLYDDITRGGGRKPAAGGHSKVAHAIATQRIKTGRINLTPNETTRKEFRAVSVLGTVEWSCRSLVNMARRKGDSMRKSRPLNAPMRSRRRQCMTIVNRNTYLAT